MLLNVDIDVKQNECNPSLILSNHAVSKEDIEFPDPNGYFILSDAGKMYTIISNSTVLLNPNKGYYVSPFRIDYANSKVMNLSKAFFESSKPIDGLAKRALDLAIEKTGKTQASLPNRL